MSDFGEVKTETPLLRQVSVPLNAFRIGNTAPKDVVMGSSPTVPALYFSKVSELITATVDMPPNWDKSKDCELRAIWALTQTQADGDSLDAAISYITLQGNFSRASSQLSAPRVVVTNAEGLAVDDMYTMKVTVPGADPDNGFAPGVDVFGFVFELGLANLTGVSEANLFGFHLVYEARY